MITPDEIRDKAVRLYPKALDAWLSGLDGFFPYTLRANLKLPTAHSELIAEVESLRGRSKEVLGYGYTVQWEEQNRRLHKRNRYPTAIVFETLEDLARFIGRKTSWLAFQSAVVKVRDRLPGLSDWLVKYGRKLEGLEQVIDDLLTVTEYMVTHPRPDCYLRELPLSVSTKLIAAHKGLLSEWWDRLIPYAIDYGAGSFEQRYGFREVRPHVMVRLLDEVLLTELGIPFMEFSLPMESLSQWKLHDAHVFVVENKINLLTFPGHTRGMALGGLGHGVTRLGQFPWMRDQRITYWGDVDVDGYLALSQFRKFYPQTQSLLMDAETLEHYRDLATVVPQRWVETPPNLTPEELVAFETCRAQQLRLEQEHLPFKKVSGTLSNRLIHVRSF